MEPDAGQLQDASHVDGLYSFGLLNLNRYLAVISLALPIATNPMRMFSI